MRLPPIPGLHTRTCKHCGENVTITDELTEVVTANMFVEIKQAECPCCRGIIVLTVEAGDTQGTTEDVGKVDIVLKRMFGKKKSR